MKKEAKRIDPLTGEEFVPKRTNQVFANSANRIRYNNLKAKEFKTTLAPILDPLVKNYKILNELLKDKKMADFHIEYLKGAGYNFKVMTHYDELGDTPTHFIFKFNIIKLENNKIRVQKL